MTRAFDLALHRAKNMSRPRPPKITVTTQETTEIDFNQNSMPMTGRGGLSSIQKKMDIGGQPHHLSYINSDEANLLKQLGGSGRPVNGIPAYYFDSDDFSFDWSADDNGEDTSEDAPVPGSAQDPSRSDITAAQITNEAALAAQIEAERGLATGGWGMYGTPEEAAAKTEAILNREAASQATAEALFQARTKLDDDYFKKAFDKLERPVGGYWQNPNTLQVTIGPAGQYTLAQVEEMARKDPSITIEAIELFPGEITGATTFHNIHDPSGFKGDMQRSQGRGAVSSWQDLKSLASVGMESGATPGKGKDFESYSEASQYVIDQIRKDRQEEQATLDRMNLYRERLGDPIRETPVGGWLSPDLYESTIFDAANWAIQTGAGTTGALLNFLQRQYGSGEFDQEVLGWKDVMDYYNNLGILTGDRGSWHLMDTYMGEKGSPGEEYDETDPNILTQRKKDKDKDKDKDKEEDDIKKLKGMERYLRVMRDKRPSGYSDQELDILRGIYPPDHPIWETINKEQTPIWPDPDPPDPDPDPDPPDPPDPPFLPDPIPPDWDPIYGPPRIDPPEFMPFDPAKSGIAQYLNTNPKRHTDLELEILKEIYPIDEEEV